MDDLDRPKQRVTALLTAAREMAWEAFDPPSDEAVMAIFERLCVEDDMARCRGTLLGEDTDVVLH